MNDKVIVNTVYNEIISYLHNYVQHYQLVNDNVNIYVLPPNYDWSMVVVDDNYVNKTTVYLEHEKVNLLIDKLFSEGFKVTSSNFNLRNGIPVIQLNISWNLNEMDDVSSVLNTLTNSEANILNKLANETVTKFINLEINDVVLFIFSGKKRIKCRYSEVENKFEYLRLIRNKKKLRNYVLNSYGLNLLKDKIEKDGIFLFGYEIKKSFFTNKQFVKIKCVKE